MRENNDYIGEILREYKRKRAKARREMKTLPTGELNVRNRATGINYTHVTYEDGKRVRKGITTNKELIYDLARKAYLKESISLLTATIDALEQVAKTCLPPTLETILKHLPKTYEALPREAFFPQMRSSRGWKNEVYDKSTHRPEEKRHIACTGERVRSKSEALIIDLLEKHNIAYRYEQMLYIENQEFAPDFTIRVGSKLFYWEHCGLVNDERYIAKHDWKIDMYAKVGIVPWKNLIVTYDDEEGHFNGRIAEAEIKNKLDR